MEILNHNALLVKCPHCGNKFSPEDAIQHDLRAKFEKEFEQKLAASTKSLSSKIQQEEQARYKVHLQRLEEDRKIKASRLKELEDQSITLQEREQKLMDREERIEH
jgi:hypothetical protein